MVDGVELTAQATDDALALLRGLGPEGLARHPCVGPDRAEFVMPGCAIFEAIRAVWPASGVTVADRGLREGMLLRMMRPHRMHRRPPSMPHVPEPQAALAPPHAGL